MPRDKKRKSRRKNQQREEKPSQREEVTSVPEPSPDMTAATSATSVPEPSPDMTAATSATSVPEPSPDMTAATSATSDSVASQMESLVIESEGAVGYETVDCSTTKVEEIIVLDEPARRQQLFPSKPYTLSKGRKVPLIANCFRIDLPRGDVFFYDVSVKFKSPAEKDKTKGTKSEKYRYRCVNSKKCREVFKKMVNSKQEFQNYLPVYDGSKYMITRTKLPIDEDGKTFEIFIPSEQETRDYRKQSKEKFDEYEVAVKPVKKGDQILSTVSLEPLHLIMAGCDIEVSKQAVMALNIILRYGPSLRYIPIGRSFYFQRKCSLGEGREMWLGYFQSAIIGQWKPFLKVDMSATSFVEGGPVLDFISKFLDKDLSKVPYLTLNETKSLTKELRGLKVETNYLGYKRKYTIKEITANSAKDEEFLVENEGRQRLISVDGYFRTRNKYKLRFPNLPCVKMTKPKENPNILPVEVCTLLGEQHKKCVLSKDQLNIMKGSTVLKPKARFEEIQKILQRVDFNNDPHCKEFGISITREPAEVPGWKILPPSICYGNQKTIKPEDGSWNMRDQTFLEGGHIDKWAIVNFSNLPPDRIEYFVDLLTRIGKSSGLHFRRKVEMRNSPECDRGTISKIFHELKTKYEDILIVVILPEPEQRKERGSAQAAKGVNSNITDQVYSDVKALGEIELGIVTQCVKSTNLESKKFNATFASNLCLKINSKRKGINSALREGEKPQFLDQKPCIIMGADVHHSAPGDNLKISIAAVVGSLDNYPFRYAVSVTAQPTSEKKTEEGEGTKEGETQDTKYKRIEIIQDLKSMVRELLLQYYIYNCKTMPEQIIFYRDGVAESQFEEVRMHEVEAIRDACKELGSDDYRPELTFIVIQKRNHTRLWPAGSGSEIVKNKNLSPGTVVDSVITHPVNYDFYLCSHSGRLGTSVIPYYHVIWDDYDFTPEVLHKLTYYLCYTNARCTKSVSIPAPAAYAHLAAFRGKCHLRGNERIRDAEISVIDKFLNRAMQPQECHKNSMYFV